MSESIVVTSTATIASGASLSDAINLNSMAPNSLGQTPKSGLRLFGIVMPSSWTTANLSFQASIDGGTTYVDIMDATGTEYVVTAGTSRFIPVDPTPFSAISLLKVRSGTTGTPVNQSGTRTLTLVLRRF